MKVNFPKALGEPSGDFLYIDGGNKMRKMSHIREMVITALCISLCVVLPLAFHAIPQGGSIYCPMHIPVLLCGLICGWQFGLFCGLAGPLLSTLILQMPPMAMLPAIMIELCAYGFVSGLVLQTVHTGKRTADLYISLIAAMLSGRVLSGILQALLFSAGHYAFSTWVTAYFLTSLPGMIIQLVLIPILITALEKANLIPAKSTLKRQPPERRESNI
jgi:thiamine transporter ThiT